MLPTPTLRHLLLTLVATHQLLAANGAHAQKELRWKLQPGEVLNYQIVQEIQQDLHLGDDAPSMKFTTTQIMDMRWQVESVDDAGVISIDQQITRVQMKMQSPQGVNLEYDSQAGKPPEGLAAMLAPMYDALLAKPIRVMYTPRGELKDMKLPEGLLNKMNQVAGGGPTGNLFSEDWMKQMGNMGLLPEGPVTANQTWKNVVTIKNAILGEITVATTFRYEGIEVRDEKPLEKIAMSIQFTPNSETKSGIVGIHDQNGEGTLYFDADAGRVQESINRMKMKMNIEILGRQMTQDMDLNTVMSLRNPETVGPSAGETDPP